MSSKKEKIKNDPKSNDIKNTEPADIAKEKDSVNKISEDDIASNEKEKTLSAFSDPAV